MGSILNDLKMQYRLGGPESRLIYINVAVYVLSIVFFYKFQFGQFLYPDWIALYPDPNNLVFRPWTVLSYAFFHAGIFHLIFNMIVLNFSGRLFRTFFNARQFLSAYLLGCVFAGLVFVLGFVLLGRANPLVGASAGIMSILIAAATYQPTMRIRLMFVGEIQLWVFALVLVAIDMLYLFAENTGGHIAHLAGAFFGFVYVKALQSGIDLAKPVTAIGDFVANLFRRSPKKPQFKVYRNYNRQPAPTASVKVTKDKTQQQIDEILDKISKSGYDSLTKQEKEFLREAGKQ